MPKKINILFIDDEENNLVSLKAAFRREFNIFTALSGEEGIRVLDENPDMHVIVTDQRMPGITGVDFLERVLQKHQKPIRILITAQSDIEAVIAAINRGQVYKYVPKPWNEDDLRAIIKDAYKIYKTKEENDLFLYKASHDLKGPLASIQALIGVIRPMVDDDSEVLKYIGLIDTSVHRVQDIMDELLEFKQLGELPVNATAIDLRNCLQDVLDSISNTKNYSKNEIIINTAQDVPFYSDLLIIKSIIQNIVTNAIKYGNYNLNAEPKVNIDIAVDKNKARLIIEDNGIGMKEDTLKSVFKMFFREQSTGISGTGLGMFITKSAVEKLDGKIAVESELGKGTKFTIDIPNYSETVKGISSVAMAG